MKDIYSDSPETVIKQFVGDWTIEVTPGGAKKITDFREYLKPGTTVYITFLPGSDFDDTIYTAHKLREDGMIPVPHLAARSIPSESWLSGHLEKMKRELTLDHVLLIGGGVSKPVGEFEDTMQLLDTGLFEKFDINNIGVAGHPEGSPDISDDAIQSALEWKNNYAARTGFNLYMTTQFIFEATPVIEWEARISNSGNKLPIKVGVPGIATLKTLLNHARACGIGPSMRFLTRQARNVSKLMNPISPDALILDLARHYTGRESSIAGIHVYPLGGLKKSAAWFSAVSDDKFGVDLDQKKLIL